LKGSAKEVYYNLPTGDADSYNVLKEALLRHYNLSAESFRKLFRESRKRPTETHGQYIARVSIHFDKWMKITGADLSYVGLRQEVIKEQVLGTYKRDLLVFLAERELATLDQISELAERYEQAHSSSSRGPVRDRAQDGDRRDETVME
jgi:hypothetical protein